MIVFEADPRFNVVLEAGGDRPNLSLCLVILALWLATNNDGENNNKGYRKATTIITIPKNRENKITNHVGSPKNLLSNGDSRWEIS